MSGDSSVPERLFVFSVVYIVSHAIAKSMDFPKIIYLICKKIALTGKK